MKTLFTLTGSMILTAIVFAQNVEPNWTNRFAFTPTHVQSVAGEMPDGTFLINAGDFCYHLSAAGDSLTSFIIPAPFGEMYAIQSLADGLLLGGRSMNGPTVAKMDTAFNIVWSSVLDGNSGPVAALLVDGTDYYASGHFSNTLFISKLNTAGDTAWVKRFPQSMFTNLTSIIKLGDGNFLASGNLDDYPIAVKFNASGDTLWTYQENIFISFQKMSAFERGNGEIVLVAGGHLIELNADGSKKSDNRFSGHYFLDMALDGGNVYLLGREIINNGSQGRPYIQVHNTDMDSLGVFRLSEDVHPVSSNGFSDVLAIRNGGFLAVGRVLDSAHIASNKHSVLAMKFNATDTATGLGHLSGENSALSIYPNPAHSIVEIGPLSFGDEVMVVDLLGDVVLRKQASQAKATLDISHLKPGLYIVTSTAGKAFGKLVKR